MDFNVNKPSKLLPNVLDLKSTAQSQQKTRETFLIKWKQFDF